MQIRDQIINFINTAVSQARVEVLEDNFRIVVKRYGGPTSLKWYILANAFRAYPFVTSGKDRMSREVEFFTFMYGKIPVPRVIDFDLEDEVLVREYIEGEKVTDPTPVGSLMRRIHGYGYVLGDTKTSNFLLSSGEAFVIDAEQAMVTSLPEHRAWDILVYLFFLALDNINSLREYGTILDDFFRSYSPDHSVTSNLLNMRNFALISIFPPLHLAEVRRVIGTLQ